MTAPPMVAFNPDTGEAIAPTLAGHVQMIYLTDLYTQEILYITPSTGGIWLNDFDLGYPEVREVSYPYPDGHGSIDDTKYYGARAVTLSVTCIQSTDDTGDYVTASTWADTIRGWTVLDRKIKLTYQLLDENVRHIYLRTSQLGMPIPGSGVDRTIQKLSLGWKSPDGMLWARPLPHYVTDPARPDHYLLTISGTTVAAGGISLGGATGIDVGDGTGIDLGGGGGTTANRVSIPIDTLGAVPTPPILTIRGGATEPQISMAQDGVVASTFAFTNVIGGSHLVVAPADILVIDVANRSAVINPDANGIGQNVTNFLAPPVNWKDFVIRPQRTNTLNYFPVGTNAASVVEVSYAQPFV
jgi:hypothetical protein